MTYNILVRNISKYLIIVRTQYITTQIVIVNIKFVNSSGSLHISIGKESILNCDPGMFQHVREINPVVGVLPQQLDDGARDVG